MACLAQVSIDWPDLLDSLLPLALLAILIVGLATLLRFIAEVRSQLQQDQAPAIGPPGQAPARPPPYGAGPIFPGVPPPGRTAETLAYFRPAPPLAWVRAASLPTLSRWFAAKKMLEKHGIESLMGEGDGWTDGIALRVAPGHVLRACELLGIAPPADLPPELAAPPPLAAPFPLPVQISIPFASPAALPASPALLARVEPDVFLALCGLTPSPVIAFSPPPPAYRYITVYAGLTFLTHSRDPIAFGADARIIPAISIQPPSEDRNAS